MRGKHINSYKLPDLLHSDVYNLSNISYINEIGAMMLIVYFIYNIKIGLIPYTDIILFIKYITILMLIKIILMNVTVLPDASGICNKIDKTKNPLNFFL